MSTPDTELILLRTFYGKWTEFHSIPRDRLHRRQQEVASQEMVEAHNALKLLYVRASRQHVALVTATGEPIPEAVNEVTHAPA